jgi:hypothetical protein
MDELQGWFSANSLILNTEKTIAMLFHSRQERDLMELQIKFRKIEIAYKSGTTFLGMHVGKHMDWKFLSSHLLSKNIKTAIYKTIILPMVLYGRENWSLTLREEHKLRVFERRVLRIIFGPRRDEVTGCLRKLNNEELHNLYLLR